MPIIPNFIERLVLKIYPGPGLMLDALGAAAFRAVAVALKLGVFEALQDRAKTAAEVARQIEADERATTLLLEFLKTSGYIWKKDNQYSNRTQVTKWLQRDSPTSFAPFLDFWQSIVFPYWDAHLEESIRQGKPAMTIYEWLDQHPASWEVAQDWFVVGAHISADEIVAKAKLPSTARRLLDVGGGHGLYSIKFCRRYPALSATVFDLPKPLAIARRTIAAENMGDRVTVREGDFSKDDLGTGYDVALLFNIIHAHLPDENTALFNKVASALNPGGVIVILDQLAGKAPTHILDALAQLFGLTYLATLGGQIYTFYEVASWLARAGLSNPSRINLRNVPGGSLVLATKTG